MLITITYILFISFYFISVNTVKTTKQLEKLILLFVTAGFFVALYGVFQYISGGPTTASWVDDEMFQDIRVRIYSTFENPNVLGEYLVLLIPLSMSILWGKKDLLSRIVSGVATFIMIIALIMTHSRGSWLGFILAIFIFFILIDRRLLVAGAFGALTLPVLLPTAVTSRFISIEQPSRHIDCLQIIYLAGFFKNYGILAFGYRFRFRGFYKDLSKICAIRRGLCTACPQYIYSAHSRDGYYRLYGFHYIVGNVL